MQLHDVTVMFVLTLAALVGAGIFTWGARLAPNARGLNHWALACVCMALSASSVIWSPDPWGPARPLLFNIPFTLSYALWLAGTLRFCRRRPQDAWVACLAGLCIALTLVFTLAWPDRALRITAIGILYIVMRLWTAWVLWFHGSASHPAIARTTASVVALESVTVVIRILDGVYGAALPVGASVGGYGVITWLGALLTVFVSTPLLMLLGVSRLLDQLRHAAHHDQLTGLLNRRGLFLAMPPLLAHEGRQNQLATVLMIDVDHFKTLNDRFGHAEGDSVLRALGQALRRSIRISDLAARWGGEEFCVVLSDTGADGAAVIAERIRRNFAERTATLPKLREHRVTVSIGIAEGRVVLSPFEHLQRQADAALYAAKEQGRDRVVLAALPAPAS